MCLERGLLMNEWTEPQARRSSAAPFLILPSAQAPEIL